MFTIDADRLEWINGQADDPEDYCLHGHVVVTIGDRKLEYDATVSAAALYLLKSLTEDHIINTDNQMLPCCGFFFVPDKELENVTIVGCGNGIDWTVRHDGDIVLIELEDGTTVSVPFSDYQREVFRFADKIESYYASCKPKIMPKDEFERNGYIAFWNEWHRRRNNGGTCHVQNRDL